MRKASQFRDACEECHERKIRCKQKDTESGLCQACQANGRRCLFSLKSKTGRPGKRKASCSFAANSFPTNSVSGTFSICGDSSTTAPSYSTVDLVPWLVNTELEDLFQPSPLQDASYWDPQAGDGRGDKPCHIIPHEHGKFAAGNSPPGNSLREEQARLPTSGEFILSNYERAAPQVCAPEHDEILLETYEGTIPEVRSSDIGERGIDSRLKPLSQKEALTNSCVPANVTEFLKVLELTQEVRVPFERIPMNEASLLADRDTPKLKILLDSLDKLCNTIGIMIEVSCADAAFLNGSTNVFIFATIMDIIKQTIRKLGLWTELDPGSRTGLRYSALSTALDFTIEPSYFGFEDTLFGSVEMESSAPPALDLQIEQVLSLTRLDFYLLRLKSFISHFDSKSELLVATASLFSPTELKASLRALHNRVDGILCAGKHQWSK